MLSLLRRFPSGERRFLLPELREAAAEKEEATTVAAKEKAGKAPANEEAARTQADPNHAAVSTCEQGAGRWLRWVL